jgi:RNA recognition motif-containing protein
MSDRQRGKNRYDPYDSIISINSESKKGLSEAPPCRTLFVRNVLFGVSETLVLKEFERFGDVKTSFSLIPKRGLMFITYVSLLFPTPINSSKQLV